MRYAVLSDIHANLEALTAVLDALASQHVDRTLVLGDLVGYGADPGACLSKLTALKAVMVAGNHDQACIGKFDLGWFNQAARAAVQWTRDQLSFTEMDQLRRLPLTATEGPFTLVHASLPHPEQFHYLMDLGRAVDTIASCRTLFCLVGHTHVPAVIECDRQRRQPLRAVASAAELAGMPYRDEADAVGYVVNPGSVGQPRDHDPRASYAIVDAAERRISVHRVAYDVASAQHKIRAAGLPAFLADRLAQGL